MRPPARSLLPFTLAMACTPATPETTATTEGTSTQATGSTEETTSGSTEETTSGSTGPGPTTTSATTTSVATSSSATTTDSTGAPGPFQLTVTSGYGDGVYPAGAVVHVWAAHDFYGEIVTGWDGADGLLTDPLEWHTTLTMPAADVTITPHVTAVEFDPVDTMIQGRDRLKRVYYQIPEEPIGILHLAHGTGGSYEFIHRPETASYARAALHRGLAVFSTEAEEVDTGDTDMDGKIRWDSELYEGNVDLDNLALIVQALKDDGLLDADAPAYAAGMSNGGGFSVTLAAALEWSAAVSFCASGRTTVVSVTEAPTAWFMCAQDQHPTVDNDKALGHWELLVDRGIRTEYRLHEPSPLYPERFTRVPGIDADTSAAIVAEIDAAGFMDRDGLLTGTADEIEADVIANPDQYPVLDDQSGAAKNLIHAQLKAVYADHHMVDDLAGASLDFLLER